MSRGTSAAAGIYGSMTIVLYTVDIYVFPLGCEVRCRPGSCDFCLPDVSLAAVLDLACCCCLFECRLWVSAVSSFSMVGW